MSELDWPDEVLRTSKIDGVFLTNDFDDPLDGFDTTKYIPCLRTDDLVFQAPNLSLPEGLHRGRLTDRTQLLAHLDRAWWRVHSGRLDSSRVPS